MRAQNPSLLLLLLAVPLALHGCGTGSGTTSSAPVAPNQPLSAVHLSELSVVVLLDSAVEFPPDGWGGRVELAGTLSNTSARAVRVSSASLVRAVHSSLTFRDDNGCHFIRLPPTETVNINTDMSEPKDMVSTLDGYVIAPGESVRFQVSVPGILGNDSGNLFTGTQAQRPLAYTMDHAAEPHALGQRDHPLRGSGHVTVTRSID